MSTEKTDHELGIDRKISRRDFLNGVAVGATGLIASHPIARALMFAEGQAESAPEYYPPAFT